MNSIPLGSQSPCFHLDTSTKNQTFKKLIKQLQFYCNFEYKLRRFKGMNSNRSQIEFPKTRVMKNIFLKSRIYETGLLREGDSEVRTD